MKRFYARGHWAWLALLVLGVAAPCGLADASYSTVILNDAPIGYWRLGEDGTNPVAADSSGSVTPMGRNGIYSRGVTSGVPGAIKGDPDTASSFDGMTSYVDIKGGPTGSTANPYNLINTPIGFSLEAWVINNGVIESTVVGRILSTRVLPPATSGGYGLGVLSSNNNVRFTTFGVKDYDSSLTNIAVDGNWHHIVVVLDSTNTATFYLDGQLTDSIPFSSPVRPSPTDLCIGRNPVPDGSLFYEYWNGSIDEVAIYNYELTGDQVAAHFKAAQ
jgi:hypothetical protein